MSLSLTIDGDEITVAGTVKGDPLTPQLLPRPWVWSRRAAGYVLPRSLRPVTRGRRIEEFRAACERLDVEVEVDDTGVVLTEAARREARDVRLEARADRHEHIAEKAAATSEAAYRAERAIGEHIPFGQPILLGHHSQRRAERDRDRMNSLTRKSIDADKVAKESAALAASIRGRLERGESPTTIRRRIERTEAEIRRMNRHLNEVRDVERPGTIAWRTRTLAERDRAVEAVDLDRAVLAELEAQGKTVTYGPHNVRPGDVVSAGGKWHRVLRANRKTVTVPTGYSWTGKIPYTDIRDVRTPEPTA